MEPSKKKMKYMQKYREEYTAIWKFIKPSALGEFYVKCDICCVDIKIANGGKNDISRHIESPKHKLRERSQEAPSVASFFKPKAATDDDIKVINAETLFANFLVEHNIPLAVADHAGALFKNMFPDSKIASQYSSARTKTRRLVGALSKDVEETISSTMKSTAFSIMTDGSNNRGSEQIYPIVVRFYDPSAKTIVSELLDIACPDGDSTGKNIFDAISSHLTDRGLSWIHCLSFGSDNASVMLGHINGVAAHVQAANPSVLIQGCPCHLLHLAARKGSEKLRYKLEDVLVDIYYYLDNSTKRLKSLESFQREAGTALRKIIKHGPTRWLSLLQCVTRLIEQWEPLFMFFKSEHQSKRSPPARLARIFAFFSSPASLLYAHFLEYALPIYTEANLLLQREEPMIHVLRERLHDVATDIIVRFIKPSAVTNCKNLFDLEHHRRSKQKDRDDLMIGQPTRTYLENKEKNGLTNTMVTEFFEDVRAFFSASLGYIFSKLPLDDQMLEHAGVLNVKKRQKAKFSSVRFFLKKFKCLLDGVSLDEAELEFAKYQVDPLSDINCDGRVDSVWHEIGQKKDSSERLVYGNLSTIMLGICTIPHSNATSERIFSMVRKNKTEARASMSRELLTDVIRIKSHMLSRDKVCHNTALDRAFLTKAKKKDF